MISAARSRTAFALVLILAVAQGASAQTTTSDAAASSSAPSAAADAGASTTSDSASPILTSGAATSDGGASPSTADLAGIGTEPPAAAVAPRPEPTPDQLAALALLEQEVDGFLNRGNEYRRSINGLLAREHESQLDRLRHGFDRQIAAERDAEGEARRHAIQVFEHFIELYPDDPDHTPDVMFRLAELYYDEAAYAKLEADEQLDRLRAQREAANQPTDDLVSPPVDYRCSILLYRHVVSRFPSFRLRDATHYLLGWVLKEMGQEDESITAYRGLVCPGRFHYEGALDLTAPLVQGQDTPVTCGHLFDILRPYGAQLESPPGGHAASGASVDGGAAPSGDTEINRSLVAAGQPTDVDPMPIPQDYAECTPLNGANGQPSRYAGEVWYYIGDYHFDNPPIGNADLGNAYAIAAYQASMRASETRRVVAASAAPTAASEQVGLRGTQTGTAGGDEGTSNTGSGVTAANSPGRAQFRPDVEYGTFWSKSLYKIGWSYFRMTNGYPRALEAFSRLLDYYDYVGAEAAAQGNRVDTIKWIGVIFSESGWGTGANTDGVDCQQVVENVAHPPRDAVRPFDCAGIMRVTSPLSPLAVMAAHDATAAAHVAPLPGRPTYIPQDRPWTPEAYLELANDYFQQTKYYEAITLYRIFLQLYPLHFQAPHVAEHIAIAYERQRQFDAAIAARGRLADYTEHSRWWDANNAHPDAQRYAEMIARNSLHDNAIQHHQHASQLRGQSATLARCASGGNGGDLCQAARNAHDRQDLQARAFETLQRANDEYGLAISAYNQFIQNYPNDEAAYEFRYNRADAMFWAGRYTDAARAYAEVRESNENDQFLVPSAYMAVKALEQQIRTMASQHQLDACVAVRAGIPAAEILDAQTGQPMLDAQHAESCAQPPTNAPTAPAGSSASPAPATINSLTIPDVVNQLMEARISYTNRVPRSLDSAAGLRDVFTPDPAHPESEPPFRPKFAYLNARTLLRFGHVQDAEARYRQILQVYCTDQTVAGAAFADLHNLLLLQGRDDDREALARQQASSTCAGVDRSLVGQVLTDARFRHAMDTFHQAEHASGQDSLVLYERAANEMRAALQANPNHPQAPLALYYTALAYERTNRFDTATQTYVRVTQEYNNLNVIGSNPPQPLEGEGRQERINILEVSNFRAAVNMDRTFDYDNAIRYFQNVVNDQRFATANDHADHVHDALASIALIQTNLGHWQQARDAWRAFLPRAEAGRERATAQYRIAEMPFRAQNWSEAVRALQDYNRTVPMSADTAEFHVQAQYNIAQALRNQGDQNGYRRELRAVAHVFEQSGQRPGSRAAVFAAEALYLDLDQHVTQFMTHQLTQGSGEHLAGQVRTLDQELTSIDDDSVRIFQLLGGEYSIGALVRNGEAHEYLATQEARVSQLFQLSAAQQHQLQRVQHAMDQLNHAADLLDRANQSDRAQQLRDRAQQLQDQIDQQRQSMTDQIQTQFDGFAANQRKSAIRSFALAIHLARRSNIPTAFAARALEHIRTEDNRPLVDDALHAMPPQLAQAVDFHYTPHMFDAEAPGATLTQQQPVATPGLAGE